MFQSFVFLKKYSYISEQFQYVDVNTALYSRKKNLSGNIYMNYARIVLSNNPLVNAHST